MIRVHSPIPEYKLPLAWFWIEPIRGRIFSDYGPTSAEEFIRQESPALNSWEVVDEAGETQACGFIRGDEEPGTVRLYLYWRRASVMAEAIREIIADIFKSEDVYRVEYRAWHDAMNVFNLCREAGGTREALLRKSSRRGGQLADQALYVWTKE